MTSMLAHQTCERIEPWRRVWRDGLGPQFSPTSLVILRGGLLQDDPRLLQRATAHPEPSPLFSADAIEGCCALGFGAWQSGALQRIGDLATFFNHLCSTADDRLGELAGCRYFLDWYDQTPRPVMRHELLGEVNRLLNDRRDIAA